MARQRHSYRLLAVIAILSVLTVGAVDVEAKQGGVASAEPATAGSTQVGAIVSTFTSFVVPRGVGGLSIAIQQLITASGASAGVAVIELGGTDPVVWSVSANEVFTAASTYKLAALMLEAANIASGEVDPNGYVCFQEDDYETGWFDDYEDGACFTRNELAVRAARYSDNTAGHMLVRDVGGAEVLNAWAGSAGATSSDFYYGNTTTAADLAALWEAEANGELGGAAAKAWLYPLLTNTRTELGVPAGVSGATVVHKTGTIDLVENDAALVTSSASGPYILVVMTDGLGGAEGWQLVAEISSVVWQFENSR